MNTKLDGLSISRRGFLAFAGAASGVALLVPRQILAQDDGLVQMARRSASSGTYLGMAFSNLVAFFIILIRSVNTPRAWNYADFDISRGRDRVETSGRPICIRALCLRYRGHRTSCGPRFGSFRRLWRWRSLPVERKPRTDAKTGGAVLFSYLRGYNPRAVAELPAHRPGEGSFLGRRSEWARFGPVNGGHYDYRVQPKGDG